MTFVNYQRVHMEISQDVLIYHLGIPEAKMQLLAPHICCTKSSILTLFTTLDVNTIAEIVNAVISE